MTDLTPDDRIRAAQLLADAHLFMVLADLRAELAANTPPDSKALRAAADAMNTVVVRLAEAWDFVRGIVKQLGEEGLRSRLFDPQNDGVPGLARVETLARNEGSLTAVFERRAELLPDLAGRVAVLAEAPLQSDDLCLLALVELALAGPTGPIGTALAAAHVHQHCG